MFCFVLFPVFTLLANSYPLAKLYQQGFLLLCLFPGDNPHLMAEIPVFSSCRHYTTFPYCISHFMSYYDLMVTPLFIIFFKWSPDTCQSAAAVPLNNASPTALAGTSLPLAKGEQLLLSEEFHQQHASSPTICQHNTPHCPPFGPCLTVLTLFY